MRVTIVLVLVLVATGCKKSGGHAAKGSATPAAKADDCRAKPLCKKQGACTDKVTVSKDMEQDPDAANGVDVETHTFVDCIATKDEDCRQSDLCKERGYCTAKKEQCVAGSEADCRASTQCKTAGKCKFDPEDTVWGCVVTDADCKASTACAESAACNANKDQNFCKPHDESECRKAPICKKQGKCSMDSSGCITLDEKDCKASEECKTANKCELDLINHECSETKRP